MTGPSAAQVDRARRLLAAEGDSGASADACAAAAKRVYAKLSAQLSPLLGAAGVEALFARSAKLAGAERPRIAELADGIDASTRLGACLQALAPAAASDTAALLFGTLLELIVTFIGDRLTVQALRGAWPAIEETAPRETKK
jgi:hypothetical protein